MFHYCLWFASLCCFDVPVGDAASASPGGVFGVYDGDVACSWISACIIAGISACNNVFFLLILWVIFRA